MKKYKFSLVENIELREGKLEDLILRDMRRGETVEDYVERITNGIYERELKKGEAWPHEDLKPEYQARIKSSKDRTVERIKGFLGSEDVPQKGYQKSDDKEMFKFFKERGFFPQGGLGKRMSHGWW